MNVGRYSRVERRAFTLIEIMIVVGIIGVIMAAGVPTLYRMIKKDGFRRTVNDIAEVCTAARARAIVEGVETEVWFHPKEGTCEVAGGAGGATGGLATSAKIEEAQIQMLDVNLLEYRDAEIAKVRFYPNGTSDEMTIILLSDNNQQRGIVLETTTAMASVLGESDLQKLQKGH
jgi:prepilin-type N-terminal cleavage/methylation domain-containing protein